jgi:hypothetical protein
MTPLAAMQAALAAEDATIYGYGVVGAWLPDQDRASALSALAAHQLQRDRLSAMITALGDNPVAAQPAYRLPAPVTGPASARALGARLEEGCAGAAWDLVSASAPSTSLRTLAIGWLADAALRAAQWGMTQALPGQPV